MDRQRRAKTTSPLAQGELFNNPYEWRFLIAERLIDFIRVHLSQIGGITAGRKLQRFAEQFGERTAWHGPGDMSPLAHAANIHIDLAARNFGVQEWSGTEPPNFVIQELKGPRAALLDVFPGLPEFRNGHRLRQRQTGFGRGHRRSRSREISVRKHRDPLDANPAQGWSAANPVSCCCEVGP
ncbi:enolase C-terminal domain-like protein [Paraburkholderia graminis]|uniref:L-alanine-DL-glutamate epimerase-like enolase superfamily enzyme n=1 Tax=Paraburkholderia graminis TaxID=60548 RepID=A0ABD5CUP5_9BURK|nr:enolase C-terminal domain-like protein [Paraburkholderia graminis]MDR6208244.1 L-alanine-DL-glutamate epimerase-like enolase superfamily enzyme [Paraburkholderia graminis]